MSSMTSNKYVPTWERKYNKWETEPEIWEGELIDEPTEEDISTTRLLASLDLMEIEEIELEEEE